jgi:hypothetical protein
MLIPRKLNRIPGYSYVCHKELNDIKSKYGHTKTQKLKMWMHYFRHRVSTGVKQMKTDVQMYIK